MGLEINSRPSTSYLGANPLRVSTSTASQIIWQPGNSRNPNHHSFRNSNYSLSSDDELYDCEEEETGEKGKKSESFQFVPANFATKAEPKAPPSIPTTPASVPFQHIGADPHVDPGGGSGQSNGCAPGQKAAWNHPDELAYPVADDWPDEKIFQYLNSCAFTIPPRGPSAAHLFSVTTADGSTISLPGRYRIPLLWTAKYLWMSVKLVLTADESVGEWENYRLSILHIGRLCNELLRAASPAGTMDKKWTCPMFDRVLVRFKHRFLMNDPATVEEFWRTYGGQEYHVDIFKFDWKRWALRGQSGFLLTENEINKGIKQHEFSQGLVQREGRWIWDTTREPPSIFHIDSGSVSPPPQRNMTSARTAIKREPEPEVIVPKPAASVKRNTTVKPKVVVKAEPDDFTPKPKPPRKRKPIASSSALQSEAGSSNTVAVPNAAALHSFPNASAPPIVAALPNTQPLPVTPARIQTLQSQIETLQSGVRFLRSELRHTEEEHQALRTEHTVSLLELRRLKKQAGLDEKAGSGSTDAGDGRDSASTSSKRKLSDQSDDERSWKRCAPRKPHPLIHLLVDDGKMFSDETTVVSSSVDDDEDISIYVPEPPVFIKPDPEEQWAGPLKSKRKMQKLYSGSV
ncbi:hypothetical protein C8J56DRAFT_1046133 [Mycena floridula]|nr:hypothetical protein C8J56DRAFT_1046133 [Mycena floridula]